MAAKRKPWPYKMKRSQWLKKVVLPKEGWTQTQYPWHDGCSATRLAPNGEVLRIVCQDGKFVVYCGSTKIGKPSGYVHRYTACLIAEQIVGI